MLLNLSVSVPATTLAPSLQHFPILSNKADLTLWERVRRGAALRVGKQAVFVRAQSSGAQQTLATLGVRAALNTWTLANLDNVALSAALNSDATLQLRAAPAHRPMSAYSLQQIDATALSAGGDGVKQARTGRGVLVGFVDTGLDLTHPAFRRADGTSRVVAVWDQDSTTGTAPNAFGYGDECDVTRIASGHCSIGDAVGHGTHVAGIAVGGGNIAGVASEADIAMVRSSDFTRLADGIAYLMQLADARNQPLVVNISVGGQYGPHDGRTPLEDYLNAAARPGRILVAAAGNDGDDYIHLAATLSNDAQRVELQGLPLGEDTQTVIELWGDGSVVADVAVELWVDGTLQASLPLGANPSDIVEGTLSYGGNPMADVSFSSDTTTEHGMLRHTLILDRSQAQFLPVGGTLVLRLQGQGSVQAWISQTNYGSGYSRFGDAPRGAGWLAGDGERSISVPATAMQVIAVGSYTIQTSWQSQTDGVQQLTDDVVGGRSAFSSMGPTGYPQFTGFKPDLVAPGSVIVSARAASVPASPDTVSPQLMVMQGTSMAAPHVAGVVALMLEANPSLSPHQVRDLLHQTARADTFTGVTPNYSWGFGKVDALSAVQAAEAGAQGCAESQPMPWLFCVALTLLVRARRSALVR